MNDVNCDLLLYNLDLPNGDARPLVSSQYFYQHFYSSSHTLLSLLLGPKIMAVFVHFCTGPDLCVQFYKNVLCLFLQPYCCWCRPEDPVSFCPRLLLSLPHCAQRSCRNPNLSEVGNPGVSEEETDLYWLSLWETDLKVTRILLRPVPYQAPTSWMTAIYGKRHTWHHNQVCFMVIKLHLIILGITVKISSINSMLFL